MLWVRQSTSGVGAPGPLIRNPPVSLFRTAGEDSGILRTQSSAHDQVVHLLLRAHLLQASAHCLVDGEGQEQRLNSHGGNDWGEKN
jgi:hypothetical protein